MGHFKCMYIKKDVSVEELLSAINNDPKKHSIVYNKLDEEFMLKYCNACGDSTPSIRDICECSGLVGNTFTIVNNIGIRSPWDNNDKFMIVNLRDLSDEYLENLEDRVYAFAVNYHNGRKDMYFEDGEHEYTLYIQKIKNRELNGIAVMFDCKY